MTQLGLNTSQDQQSLLNENIQIESQNIKQKKQQNIDVNKEYIIFRSVEETYNEIGGFGRLQFIALILIGLIRNFGMHQFYGFGISTFEIPAFLCRDTPNSNYTNCSRDFICEQQKRNLFIEFMPNQEDAQYFDNWYLNMNFICMDKSKYNMIGSSYFIGYFVGSIIFFLPDKFGRKGTFNMVLPLYILSCYLSLFPKQIKFKILGFFMQGFFHIKTALSYQHIYELVPQNKKVLCSTFLTSLDSSSVFIISFFLKFFTKNLDEIFYYIFYVQTAGILIFFLIIPESPYWQIYSYGNKSSKAIDNLNYIAWFNGSKYRVSYQSQFDKTQQFNEDKIFSQDKVMININVSPLSLKSDKSYIQDKKSVLKEIKEIYCIRKNCVRQCILTLIWGLVTVIYFLAIFNSTQLKGDVLTLGMMLGFCEILGIIGGDRCLKLFPDHVCFYISIILTLAASILLKFPGINEIATYTIFFVQVFSIGLIYGVIFLIQESRTAQHLNVVSQELNFCFAYIIAAFTPQISKMGEPYPMITYVFCCSLCILLMCMIGPQRKNQYQKSKFQNKIESTQTTEVESQEESNKLQLF